MADPMLVKINCSIKLVEHTLSVSGLGIKDKSYESMDCHNFPIPNSEYDCSPKKRSRSETDGSTMASQIT